MCYFSVMRRAFIAVLILVVVAAAGDKPKFGMKLNAGQYVELRAVPQVTAEQSCDNWAWAAAVQTSLNKQNVPLDQRYWIMKLNGGLVCISPAPGFEELKRVVDGEYLLDDKRTVRLEVRYTNKLPETTDALMLPLANGRPYILMYKGRYLMVIGAKWDEYIYQTGQKMILIKELTLLDQSAKGDQRVVHYDRERDGTQDLGGMFDVVATEVVSHPWAPK